MAIDPVTDSAERLHLGDRLALRPREAAVALGIQHDPETLRAAAALNPDLMGRVLGSGRIDLSARPVGGCGPRRSTNPLR